MQVTYTYRESSGEYNVDAEVSEGGRVTIVAVTDEYNKDIPLDDFSESEQWEMVRLALREYHNVINSDDDDSPLDDDDNGEESYA